MRIVAVEEHLTFPDLLARIGSETLEGNGWPAPGAPGFRAVVPSALEESGQGRLAAMDTAGVTRRQRSGATPRARGTTIFISTTAADGLETGPLKNRVASGRELQLHGDERGGKCDAAVRRNLGHDRRASGDWRRRRERQPSTSPRRRRRGEHRLDQRSLIWISAPPGAARTASRPAAASRSQSGSLTSATGPARP